MSVDHVRIGRRSKRKGNRYENIIAKLLSKFFGIPFRRVPASGALAIKGDIMMQDYTRKMPLVIDCKDNKALLGKKLTKAIHEEGLPIVLNDEYVLIDLEDFLMLLKEANVFGESTDACTYGF